MKQLGLFLIIIFILSGCAQVQPLEIRSVTCCDLLKATGPDTQVGFKIQIYNPNDFAISVKRYGLDVRINGSTIGTANSDEAQVIPPMEVVEKQISVTASTQQLISGTLMMGISALMRNDPTTLEIEVAGSVVGSAKGISKRVRIRESYPLKMHP